MSVASLSKGEKSKKFQSLNINNLYQGSASKPQTRSAPQKHGLQSLGKVPTARRAPANLPSLKAENSGNDPTINLVPSGSSAGWVGKDENGKSGNTEKKIVDLKSHGSDGSKTWQAPDAGKSAPNAVPNNLPQGPFINQANSSFTDEFPTLDRAAAIQASGNRGSGHSDASGGHYDPKYGPGPNLRPQTSGNWLHGGGSRAAFGTQEDEAGHNSQFSGQHHNQHGTQSQKSPPPRFRQEPLQFDVGKNAPLLGQVPGNPISIRKHYTTNHSEQGHHRGPPPGSFLRGKSPMESGAPLFKSPPVIDTEKLKRVDYFENSDDDWHKYDDYDYKKRTVSDDEAEEDDEPWERGVGSSGNSRSVQMQSGDMVNNMKRYPNSSQPTGAPSSNDVVQRYHQKLTPPPLDDEDELRAKKKEEVLKNIERARKRREEEENKYKGEKYQVDFDEDNHANVGLEKKPSFGKFDVMNGRDTPESTSSITANAAPVKPPAPTNQRFKRHEGQLHSFQASAPSDDVFVPKRTQNDTSAKKDNVAPQNAFNAWRHPSDNADLRNDSPDPYNFEGDAKRQSPPSQTNEFPSGSRRNFDDNAAHGIHNRDNKRREKQNRNIGPDGRKSASDPKSRHTDQERRSRGAPSTNSAQGVDRSGPGSNVDSKQHSKKFSELTSKGVSSKGSKQPGQSSKPEGGKGHPGFENGPVGRKGRGGGGGGKRRQDFENDDDWSKDDQINDKERSRGEDERNWFQPRGQPSRMGRGGSSSVRGGGRGGRGGGVHEQRTENSRDAFVSDDFSDQQFSAKHEAKNSFNKHSSSGVNASLSKRESQEKKVSKQQTERSDEYLRDEGKHRRHHDGQGAYGRPSQQQDHLQQGGPSSQRQGSVLGSKQPTFERRQNKLPPRLAKQREQSRMAQKGSWGVEGNNNAMESVNGTGQWRSSCDVDKLSGMLDQMDDFKDKRSSPQQPHQQMPTSAIGQSIEGGAKPMISTESQEGSDMPVQTIIFENTNFKGGPQGSNSEKVSFRNDFKSSQDNASLHLPLGFSKTEDSADLKLDFHFESDMSAVEEKMESTPGGMVASSSAGKSYSTGHSTDDLNLKIASVKKVWEAHPSMDGGHGQMNFVNRFQSGEDMQQKHSQALDQQNEGLVHHDNFDKQQESSSSSTNVAKVRPQQQPQQSAPQQQQQHQSTRMNHPQTGMVNHSDFERALHRGGNGGGSMNTFPGNRAMGGLQSPASMLSGHQLYQPFQLDGRNVTNQLYGAPYAGLGTQSMLLQASNTAGADIFGAAAAAAASNSQFRLQFPNQHTTGNPLLMSQQNMMTSALKHQPQHQPHSQIGPIGTKAGNGQFQQSGLGPVTASSPLVFPYETPGYLPNPMHRAAVAASQPSQSAAFYQALANSAGHQGGNRQAQLGMAGFSAGNQSGMHMNPGAGQIRNQHGHMNGPSSIGSGGLKNLRGSESYSPHQGVGGVQRPTPSSSAEKEGYNPTPIQRPQASMMENSSENSKEALKSHLDE